MAAGIDITYKILYNGAVAMTGGQDVAGAIGVPELTQSMAAEGVTRIIVCSDDPDRHTGGGAAGHRSRGLGAATGSTRRSCCCGTRPA